MPTVKNIAVIVIILLLLIVAVKQQIDLNEKMDEIESLQSDLAVLKYNNEKMQNDLELSKDELLEKQARESGYKDPDARYFYNDFAD